MMGFFLGFAVGILLTWLLATWNFVWAEKYVASGVPQEGEER